MQLLVGDVLLSAACIAYYGAFPGDFRQELVSGWVQRCKEFGIPVSPDCTLRGVLASPIQVLTHASLLPTQTGTLLIALSGSSGFYALLSISHHCLALRSTAVAHGTFFCGENFQMTWKP